MKYMVIATRQGVDRFFEIEPGPEESPEEVAKNKATEMVKKIYERYCSYRGIPYREAEANRQAQIEVDAMIFVLKPIS